MPGVSRVAVDGGAARSGAREVYVSPNMTSEVNLYVDASTLRNARCGAPVSERP